MSWRYCKDTDSRNKINCQIIFRIFKRSKKYFLVQPSRKKWHLQLLGNLLLFCSCLAVDKDQEWPSEGLSRAGLAGSGGVGMAVGCPRGTRGGGTSLLPQRSHRWSLVPPARRGGAPLPRFGGSTSDGTAIPIPALLGPSQWDAVQTPRTPDPSWAVPSPTPTMGAPAGAQGWARVCPAHPVLPLTGEPRVPNIFKLTLHTNNQG